MGQEKSAPITIVPSDRPPTVINPIAEKMREALASCKGQTVVSEGLVIPHNRSHDHSLTIPLGADPFIIGRSPDATLPFTEDSSMSRRHAKLYLSGGRRILEDLNSTNGVLVNDKRVSSWELTNGDTFRLGETLFTYTSYLSSLIQSDGTADAAHRESLPPGTLGMQPFCKRLEECLLRAASSRIPVSLVSFQIDNADYIRMEQGTIFLEALSNVLLAFVRKTIHPDFSIGKLPNNVSVILLPERSWTQAISEAMDLRSRLVGFEPEYNGEVYPVTVSFGVASRTDSVDVHEFLRSADSALVKATKIGRSQVYPESPFGESGDPTGHFRVPLTLERFIRKMLANERNGGVIGFEIPNSVDIRDMLGDARSGTLFQELLDDVFYAIGPEDQVAEWKNRCVFIGLNRANRSFQAELIRLVRARWLARQEVGAGPSLPRRKLRHAFLDGNEVTKNDKKFLFVLAERMVEQERPVPRDGILHRLPLPVANASAMIETCDTNYTRLKTVFDGIESILKFLTAVEIGTLSKTTSGRSVLHSVFKGKTHQPVSMGQWREFAITLRKKRPEPLPESIERAISVLDDKELMSGLSAAVEERNKLFKSAVGPDDTYAIPLARNVSRLEVLMTRVTHLQFEKMFSVKGHADDDDEEEDDRQLVYLVRCHQGPSLIFPLEKQTSSMKLRKDWCYLRSSDDSLIPLAPIFFARACDASGRIEVFSSTQIVFGPQKAQVVGRSIGSNFEEKHQIPWRDFGELVEL